MPVTLKDIANAVGVSQATVSNALNDRNKMNIKTKELILETAKNMGYSANISARNLAKNRSKTIGIVVPNLENPFYGGLVRKVSVLCNKRGFVCSVYDSFESIKKENEAVERMVSERIEGLLIAPVNYGQSPAEYIPLLEKHKIKYCFVTNRIPSKNYPFVMSDLSKGTFDVTTHLLDNKKKNIYFLVGKGENPISAERIKGYRQAFSKKNISFDPSLLIECDNYDYKEGYLKTKEILSLNKKPDAIITINDYMAMGVLSALNDDDVKVPKDISVAGYDDMFFSEISLVPLTTVRQNLDEMCVKSVDLLFDMITGEKTENEAILLKPELVIRASTKS